MLQDTHRQHTGQDHGSGQPHESCSPQQAYQKCYADGLKSKEKATSFLGEVFSKSCCYRGDRNFPDSYKAGYFAAKSNSH